jgi:hypothetical protein
MSLSPKHEEHGAIPAHPYRDSAIFYGALAAAIVVLSAISSTGLAKGLAVGGAFWVAATAWSWWRFRARIKRQEKAKAAASETDGATMGTGDGR